MSRNLNIDGTAAVTNGYYENDEPRADLEAAFDRGEKHVTVDPCVDCDDDTCAVCHNEGRDVDHIEIRDAFGNVLKSWDEPADPSYPFNDDEIRATWDMLTGRGVKLPRWRAALVRIGDWARTVKP